MDSPDKVRIKLNGFFRAFATARFAKKSVIIDHEEPYPESVYFLEQGFVAQSMLDGENRTVMVNIFRPYSYFPMINILNGTANKYRFSALTDILVRQAPVRKALVFTKANPDILFDLSRRFSIGIEHLLQMIRHLQFDRAKDRVFSLMSELGGRFGQRLDGHLVIDFPLTHRDIASFTGLSRETVSREFGKLEKESLVHKRDDKIYVRADGILPA